MPSDDWFRLSNFPQALLPAWYAARESGHIRKMRALGTSALTR
jgi:hypothetical protein